MKRRNLVLLVVLLGTIWCERDSLAQPSDGPGPLAPDRPTVSTSAWTVPRGYAQLEIGITHYQDSFTDGTTEVDFGVTESLVTSARFGWTDFIELQLNYLGVIDITDETTFDDGTTLRREFNGSSDFDVGAKLSAWQSENQRWGVAGVLGLTLPTGEDGFGTDGFDPRGVVALSGSLTDRLAIDLNVGLDFLTIDSGEGDETFTSAVGALALGWAIRDNVGVTVEFSSFSDTGGDGQPSNVVLGAFSVRFRENFQADFSVGGGVNDSTFDWLAGGGVSVRLPD
jgi:hypothetical protein